MFFYLSKIIWFFIQPSSFFYLLLTISLVLLRCNKIKFARRLLAFLCCYYLLMAYLPLGRLLLIPLENHVARIDLSQFQNIDGIIVLGGAENPWVTKNRDTFTFFGSGERFSESVIFANQFPHSKIVFTGGLWFSSDSSVKNRPFITKFYQDSGIAEDRILVEDASRNTQENARFVKMMINPKPNEKWVLMTSAFHMPRALGSFQKVGFDVLPLPVDYRTSGWQDLLKIEYYARDGIDKTDIAAKEYVGLFVYWLTGRIPSLFPK